MWKLLQAIMPACCTFGPFFMVVPKGNDSRIYGAMMLMLGLTILARTVYRQSLELKELHAALAKTQTPAENKG